MDLQIMDVGPADEELFQQPAIAWDNSEVQQGETQDEVLLLVEDSPSSAGQYLDQSSQGYRPRAAAPEDSKKCPVCETPVHKRSLKRHIITQVNIRLLTFFA